MSVITFNDLITDPDIPSSGKTKIYTKNGDPHWRKPDGTVHSLSIPVFGQNVDLSVFKTNIQSTSGSSWSNYISVTIPSGVSGTFVVFASVFVRLNNTGGDGRIRIAQNNSTIGEHMSEEMKDSSASERVPRTLIKPANLTAGDTVTLDIATERNSDTMTVYEGYLLLWRIA